MRKGHNVTSEWLNIMLCSPHKILGSLNHEHWNESGLWRVWGAEKVHTACYGET